MRKHSNFTRISIFFLLVFCCEIFIADYALCTQNQEMLKKWKNAVIHIEGALDWGDFEELMKKNKVFKEQIKKGLIQKLNRGEISEEKYNRALQDSYELYLIFSKNLRARGSAVFMKYKEGMYLITARHVLEKDKTGKVYTLFFFPQRLDIMLSESKIPIPRLMNIGVGPEKQQAYSFHSKLDLAIISLNTNISSFHGKRFADTLISLGRSPITIQDIKDEPSSEGAEVLTVGFLSSTSELKDKKKPHPNISWDTDVVSLPTLSFGKIAILHPKLDYFWCDMSVYPGNSGGPVIENGKLIGIVSGQPKIRDTGRIPFACVIKAKYIKDLLKIQIQKDSLH